MADTYPGIEQAEKLEASIDELIARLAALPEGSFTARASIEDWTAAEVVAHMTEMLPYWTRVVATAIAEPDRPLGRAMDDPDRLGPVATANAVPRSEALNHLRHAVHEAATFIRGITDAQWRTVAVHRVQGPLTVNTMVRTLMVDHAENHVQQALRAAGGT